MRVDGVRMRDFRGYREAQAFLGAGLTVISGPNGAGKSNLLEALYFGCTGRSCRTSNERELVRFGAHATRVVIDAAAEDGPHELSVAFVPGQPKGMQADGANVERMVDVSDRPLVSVFLPDRLELVKGAPALRRAHLDQFVAAMWPARRSTRRAYAQALAQRNALIARIRSGRAARDSLEAWDRQLAQHGVALMGDRRQATHAIAPAFHRIAGQLGLDADPGIAYRPRSCAGDAAELAAELRERSGADLERGFTTHGPHRDDLTTSHAGRELRTYGSQGQQRLGLLALLLAERETIAATRTGPPLMLLDDVMSELDGARRHALVELLVARAGQTVISTTDLDQVPGARESAVHRIGVSGGRILQDALAA